MRQDTPSWNQAQGRLGEAFAKKYLLRQGYKIVAERFRTRFGEIDLVASRRNALLFVEVKARHSRLFGDALEAVTPKKLRHFQKSVMAFLQANPQYRRGWHWELAAAAVRHAGGETKVELVRILPGGL
ncbi:MAG TPA: YraN family protein [bacterium]|nr:YraN family protein [bacterium]